MLKNPKLQNLSVKIKFSKCFDLFGNYLANLIKDYYNIKFLNIGLTYLIEELPYSTLVASSQLILLFLDLLKFSNFTSHERTIFYETN
jgi:hypothetical protein